MKVRIIAILCPFVLFSTVNAIEDPLKEIPTDNSISVTIENVIFKMRDIGNGFAEIILEVNGTSSGNVTHCGIAFITYYKNGTNTYNAFIEGPIYLPNLRYPIVFIGTGENESWEKWKFYNKQEVEKQKLGLNESQLPSIESFEILVRAYKDPNLWNQTCMNVTEIVKKELKGFYEEKNSNSYMPYYVLIISLLATMSVIVSIILIKRKK